MALQGGFEARHSPYKTHKTHKTHLLARQPSATLTALHTALRFTSVSMGERDVHGLAQQDATQIMATTVASHIPPMSWRRRRTLVHLLASKAPHLHGNQASQVVEGYASQGAFLCPPVAAVPGRIQPEPAAGMAHCDGESGGSNSRGQ